MLELERLRVQYGDTVALDTVDLTVADREVVCVLGPSGSGKSTLLRATAGLERPVIGRVRWDGEDITNVPPHRRQFGLMFQDHALFPHRDVLGNVAFGLRMQRMAGTTVEDGARAALARVGLAGFEHRRVRELSGGEQQRVALARALAPDPRLLMLDEPLGSLDRELRERLAAELRALFISLEVTALFVTHDQDEAFALADRVVIMRAGTIEQVGAPQEVWRRPATEFAARFLGFANIVDATIDADGVHSAWGVLPRSIASGRGDGAVRLAARPDGLRIDAGGSVRGRVTGAIFRRDHFLVLVDTELGALEVAAVAPPEVGEIVGLVLEPDAAVVLSA
ncbi:MAG: ABC transporter ATP-binding protein [Acidimicrobiia bacterium]